MLVRVKPTREVKAKFLKERLLMEILRGEKNIKEIPFDVRSSGGTYYTYAFRCNRSTCNHVEYMKVWELLCSDMQHKHTEQQADLLFFLYQRYRDRIDVPTSNGTCNPK